MPLGRPLSPLTLLPAERPPLLDWTRRPKTAQALALRARIVLLCASGLSNTEVARRDVIGASARELKARLRTATPCIEINPHTGSQSSSQGVPAQPNALVVTTFLLNPGEEFILGRQIRKVLKNPKSVGTYPTAPSSTAA